MALFGGPKPKRDSVIGNMETQINSVWDVTETPIFSTWDGPNYLNLVPYKFEFDSSGKLVLIEK